VALFVSILLAAVGAVLTLVSDTALALVGVFLFIFGTAALYVWLVCRRARAERD
jgi:uncharacterized membrane protein YbaN (DUF454 family)